MDQVETSDGISDGAPVSKAKHRSRVWIGTFNNPASGVGCSPQQMSQLLDLLHPSAYVFQLEEGASGTPHYQLAVSVKNAIVLPSWVHSAIHWESARNGFKTCAEYCSKKEGRIAGPWTLGYEVKADEMDSIVLYPWQQRLKAIIEAIPSPRLIYWFWDPVGNTGKTTFCKYIVSRYSAIYLDGKAADCKCAVASFVKRKTLKIAVFDFVRSKEDYVSYEALESIKNGIFFSGKYESGMVVYSIPHVICFANFAPDVTKLSHDRWFVREIGAWQHDVDVALLNPLGGLYGPTGTPCIL